MSEPDLKPCPFCGWNPTDTADDPHGGYITHPDNCFSTLEAAEAAREAE